MTRQVATLRIPDDSDRQGKLKAVTCLLMLLAVYELYYVVPLMNIGFAREGTLVLKVSLLGLLGVWGFFGAGFCLTRGLGWDLGLVAMYWLCVFASSYGAWSNGGVNAAGYVVIQGILLICLCLAMFRVTWVLRENKEEAYLTPIWVLMLFLVGIGLLGALVGVPGSTYRDVWGNVRVQGVYGEPSKLAQMGAMGLLFAGFTLRSWKIKMPVMLAGLAGIYLAGNRSYMVALLFIGTCTAFTHAKKNVIRFFVLLMFVFGFAGIALSVWSVRDLTKWRYLRLESLETFSGRTVMWSKALPVALEKPLGSGFLLGGNVLLPSLEEPSLFTSRRATDFRHGENIPTLHNGYLQALADLGLIGMLVYVMLFLRGTYLAFRAWGDYRMRLFSAVFGFFAICNLSATMLVSPLETNSALFWFVWFTLVLYHHREAGAQAPLLHTKEESMAAA
jgi:O-antigen ligase